MYYNVIKMFTLPRNISVRARLAARKLRRLDPRIARLYDPRPGPDRRIVAVLLLAGLTVAGAAAIAATGAKSNEADGIQPRRLASEIDHQAFEVPRPEPPPPLPSGDREDDARHDAQTPERHPRFYDPIYVFTEEPARAATAYPLADPPGVVVNLEGTSAPQADPLEMVGKDDRILAVKRRQTAEGIRYIIRISTPVKRIETEHEGNVVIILPIR